MTELLVPDTPAGQRSNRWQDEMVEPSCCGPVRPKINTTPIKLHSIVYIVCGVLSIGLGITACVFECLYNGLSIPAGVLLIATGVVGLCVRKHGALAIVYGCLNPFCFLYGIALLVFMLVALPERESDRQSYCSSYDCKWDYYDDGCCYATNFILRWKNAGIDLAILVVGVIVMVTSLAASTLSLHDLNWVKLCCLKKNMRLGQGVDSGSGSAPSGQSSPAMKPCWTPCESNGHRNATIILSIINMSIGVISVGLGIGAIIVECRFAHIGMPIWTGILIFMVTGFYGFLSVTEKGACIPCFFAFSMLAFLMSINMFSWAAVSIPVEGICAEKCLRWCSDTQSSGYPYWYTPDPRRYCCEIDYDFCSENTEEVVLDSLIIFFGVLEMLVCMATFGLSFSQLSCYFCCRNGCSTCKCCETKTNTAYQMVMTTDGNMMMVAVPNTQHGMTPSLVNNQQMIPQPMVIPANQLTAGQNQTSGSVPPNTDGGQLLVQGNGQPQPMVVQGQRQPMMAQGQVQPMVVQGQSQPIMVQGQRQQMMAKGQVQPMVVVKGQRQPMVVQGQVQPMVVQEQSPPMVVQGQVQPMMVQGQSQPMMFQGQSQPMVVQGQSQPMMAQGQVQPMVLQGQRQPMITQGQVQPMVLQRQSQPMMAQGQSQPMINQGQRQPMIVQTQGQGIVASGQVPSQPGMPTQSMFIQQPVVPDGQDAGVVQSQMQQNNQPTPQSQLTNQTASAHVQAGSLPQGVESPAVVSEDANQGIGVIPNPTV